MTQEEIQTTYRFATLDDVPVLARMSRELTEDERHRNRSRPLIWFEERMRNFLIGGYRAVLFERDGQVAAYALYADLTDSDTIYLRQLFVERGQRRRGIGREAMRLLMDEVWPLNRRLTVEVLVGNKAALAFYRAIGYHEYSIELEILASGRGKDNDAP